MKKVFPFYKGKCISKTPLGYTSKQNAKKRMDTSFLFADFVRTFPEDYWLEHYVVKELENPWDESIRAGQYLTAASTFWYHITIYTKGYTKSDSEKFLNELPSDVHELFVRLYNLRRIVEIDHYDGKETYKEEYESLLHDILRNGYFPHFYKDERDYKKRWQKFIADNVEFKEMEVNINVKEDN